MRKFLQLNRLWGKILKYRGNKIVDSFLFTVLVIISLAAIISIINAPDTGYSPTSEKCISCHNDTTFPNDTNGDGVLAPYKRPHNNTVMCESCHLTNPHTLGFIQTNGLYGSRSTATSCPGCHQENISNVNFTSAPKIPVNFTHSDKPSNGSRWGNYWNNTEPRTACKFCHDDTLHNITPIGRILNWTLDKQYASCSGCHYKGDSNWSFMKSTFESAGLDIPPEITNGTSWNGNSVDYFNHTLESYDNEFCKYCHGELAGRNASFKDFVHNVAEAQGSECMGCHSNPQTGNNITYPAIELASFGKHSNTNNTTGDNVLTNDDCITCHYDFNFSEMMQGGFTTKTRICTDCHTEGNFSAPIIKNHKPPKVSASAGGNITTTAYCSTCHNNSINKYAYSVNASVGHYGTNTSLVKTVNQTSKPRFGFMSQGDAQNYNKDCNNCHNPSNSSYGNATLITTGHTNRATCNECHMNGSASDLHNDSLGIPVTFNCISCHTTYADKYGAPNLIGTPMDGYTTCNGGSCHGYDISENLDTLAKHNVDRTFSGRPGSTDTVYLNNNVSLTVTKGAIVNITSRVNDALLFGGASKIGGAEYYIDTDPGQGKGIPMDPLDGHYDALLDAWESVKATLNTSSLSNGNHTIFVRGMDIGKQWSAPKNATLVVQSNGLISGAVTNESTPVAGALITVSGGSTFTYTDINGNYTLTIQSGTYNVTASKQPEFYDNISTGVVVNPDSTITQNFNLILKLKGIISGIVTSI